ncbi:hypothetical protein N8I77_002284 [Diaporthe amygdali]|uniref:Uncharacterized protein n=1 Tax=Phomopsis amygdali TaxID=1214568 RepID=A0AAD9ST38_PHOAM|nr:hypothetical protein N8I77_002284 [Diaporthe amygdali]
MVKHYYYLDGSCPENFDVVFKRAQVFAARALERLNDLEDVEFAHFFELIFKTTTTDVQPMMRSPNFEPSPDLDREIELRPRPVAAHVRRDLYDLANNWNRTNSRAHAQVRIHFADIDRYQQQTEQMYFDPINFLIFFADSKADFDRLVNNSTALITHERPVELRLTPDNYQHPQRSVVDFTQMAKNLQISWEEWEAQDLAGVHINEVAGDLIEITLIHEILHCNAYRLADFPDENDATCGWSMLMGLTKEQSYLCAESIAMLSLAAGLADLKPVHLPEGHGYTISRQGEVTVYSDLSEWTVV